MEIRLKFMKNKYTIKNTFKIAWKKAIKTLNFKKIKP